MPASVTKAIYGRLTGSTALTALLSTYSSQPAVFTDERVPEDAGTPYIHTHGNVSNIHFDTKPEKIEEVLRDITVIVDRGEQDTLDSIDILIHDLFHRHALAIDGGTALVVEMSGPISAPTDEYVVGSIHTLRLRYELD